MNISQKINKLPKTDLHIHLDGSLRLSSLIEMAKDLNIQLPYYDVEELKEKVFKERYNGLGEYLEGFQYTCAVMRNLENIERVSYELAIDNQIEGVRYIEPRFAPQLLMNGDELSMEEILVAVDKGLNKAKIEFNKDLSDKELPFEYGIIVCAMRKFESFYSPYYQTLFESNKKLTDTEVIQKASLELAKEVIEIRDRLKLPLVGFDLAGQEEGFPAEDFKEAYDYIHKNFMHKTVHAGEAYGAESIFQALTDLNADRIGHGYYLFDEEKVKGNEEYTKTYIKNLSSFLAEKRITIEVCLTSNFQTNPDLAQIKNHTLKKMLEHKVPVTICTDNRLVSRTTITKEWELAANHFSLNDKQLKDIAICGFKRSFFPGHYGAKDDYVQKAIKIIDKAF